VTRVAVRVEGGRVRFAVHVQPRASRLEIAGVHGDALKVRLTAPPVDGAANRQLKELLADTFAVSVHAIRILAGEGSRSKVVEIDGVSERDLEQVAVFRR
jgi:uncharacterized protein